MIKNNVTITLTSKKTAMQSTLIPLMGVPITETMDDGLNTAVLTFKDDTKTLYEPFDPVDITYSDGTTTNTVHYVVGGNQTSIYNPAKLTYNRSINLVEPTKILDRFTVYNLNLTNKNDTLLVQAQKAINNVIPLVDDDTCKFALSPALTTLLSSVSGEDFFFKNTTLRDVLDEMLSTVDCRCYVEKLEVNATTKNYEQIIISYKDKNAITDISFLFVNGDIINDEHENDLGDYSGKIQARGYNSVNNNPVTIGPEYFKSTSNTLDTNTAMADLHFPIYSIQNFIIFINSYFKFNTTLLVWEPTDETTNYYIDDINIEDKLITAEEYNVLPNTSDNNISKEYYLPYSLGDTAIGLSVSTKGIFGIPNYSLTLIVGLKIAEKLDEMGAPIPQVSITADKVLSKEFTCTFIPRVDTTIEISKPGIYDPDRLQLGIKDSQSANSIDISRHGKNLSGLIRRTGNEQLNLDFHLSTVSELTPIMSRISSGEFENFVIYKREYSIFDYQIKVRYYLTYDYNNINEKLGIVREKRIYNIPLESDDTPIFCKQYMILSLAAPTNENNAFLQPDYMAAILDTLRGISASDCKIKNILFNTPESFVDQDGSGATLSGDSARFVIPALGYAAGNTINIMANPLDNYSVGYSRGGYHISLWGGGVKMLYNPYSDINGENVSFKFRLAGKLTNNSAIDNLPKADTSDFIQASNDELIYYKKDRSQRPVFLQSFEIIPSAADYGKIIVGNKFCAENFLIKENADFSDNMFIYEGVLAISDNYRTGDNKVKTNCFKLGKVKDYFSNVHYYSNSDNSISYFYMYATNSSSLLTHNFAIADNDKNLYLAVNQRLVSGMLICLQAKKLSEF